MRNDYRKRLGIYLGKDLTRFGVYLGASLMEIEISFPKAIVVLRFPLGKIAKRPN